MNNQIKKNSNILITGCSSGIGYFCAHHLKERGHNVIASCRKAKDVTRLRDEGLDCLQIDLEHPESIKTSFDEIMGKTRGVLDALLNNGAYGQLGAVEEIRREELLRLFETNVFGWHELTRLVLPNMITRGKGRIIQISSVLGFVALKFRGAYVSSKYALEGMTDTLRLELHGTGVKVCLIEPGPILSDFKKNELKAFEANIEIKNSRHYEDYMKHIQRLTKKGPAGFFTLGPEAVYKSVLHALESPRPKSRYYVTLPTYILGGLKRVLPDRVIDWILRSIS